MKECLVIGYGSIGKRHSEVLTSLGHKVSIVSKHLAGVEGSFVFRSVEEAFAQKTYDYIVIATATVDHSAVLKQVVPFLTEDAVCFVEKPLFSGLDDVIEWQGPRIKLCVGYVLRAHPLLRKIKDLTAGKRIYSCRASCGQYLPSWRPGTDYTKCYSAHKEQGGGVLRDLSHELDYMQMLCGTWESATALGGKYSDLQITSDDQFGVLFRTEKCPLCICHIDYLSRDIHRDLFVEYEGGSLKLDFIKGSLLHNGIEERITLERNDMFKRMHTELMAYDLTYFSSAEDAYDTLKLIDAAEKTAGRDRWIKNR